MAVSKTFSDLGVSESFYVKKGDSFTYTVDLSNDFDGVLYLRYTNDNQNYTLTEISADATAILVENSPDGSYDFKCEYGAGEVSLTGTAAVSIAAVSKVLHEVQGFDGSPKFQVKEDGLVLFGDHTADGVGALNGATVTSVEKSMGTVHQTVLTLASTPVSVVSVTTGNGVGGTKIYDFPEGYINVLGCVANLTLAVETQGDFTDATPEGDVGIGSVAPANADALGTDATDDDYATATAFTMDAYAASVACPPDAAGALFDGTSTAKDVYVNVLVDAADIDDGATTNVLVSGTVTITWINLGDY